MLKDIGYMPYKQWLLIFFIVLSTCLFGAGGVLPGAGTELNPYKIEDYADLKRVGINATYSKAKIYQLNNDIDASASAGENGGLGFIPIGTSAAPFTGKLYGKGKTIQNLHINRPATNNIGLFGYLNNTALIDSVGLVNAYIKGRAFVGGIAGYCNNSTVSHCYNTDSVIGLVDNVGGIVGYAINATITGCWNEGGIRADNLYSGGIAGYASAATFSACYNSGNISSLEFAGGIVGYTTSACTISNCYNRGSITASSKNGGGIAGRTSGGTIASCSNYGHVFGYTNAGGICGYANSTIQACYNVATIEGNTYVGGISGYLTGAVISKSYQTGLCKGASFIGGIAGYGASSTIKNTYSTGDVIGTTSSIGGFIGQIFSATVDSCYNAGSFSGANFSGGFAGSSFNGIFTACYYNTETTNTTVDIGVELTPANPIVGVSIAEMKDAAFVNGLNYTSTWGIRNDSTYPTLQGVNNAPFAFPDTIRTGVTGANYGIPMNSCFANNYDYETGKDSLLFTTGPITNGTTDGTTLFFSPPVNNGNSLSFTYRIGEKNALLPDTLWGNTATTVVIIDNQPPIIQTTNYSTNEDSITFFTLNAIDPNNDSIYYSILSSPTHGNAIIYKDTILYTPETDFFGVDSIQLKADDGWASSASWILITVLPVNDPPVARDTLVTGIAGLPVKIKLAITDVDDSYLLAHIYQTTANGSASIILDSIYYTSNPFYTGNDTVRWYATDTSGATSDTVSFVIILSAPFVQAASNELDFDALGGTQSVAIQSNTLWSSSSSEPWVVVSPLSASGNATAQISVSTNTNPINRQAIITLSAAGVPDITITVNQQFIEETSIEILTDSASSCDREAIQLEYVLLGGQTSAYRIVYDTKALNAGFLNTAYQPVPAENSLFIAIPSAVKYGNYTAFLQFRNSLGVESALFPFAFTINLSSDIIIAKSTVLLIDTLTYPAIDFTWYKNGQPLTNETEIMIADMDGFSGSYQVKIMLADSSYLFSCEKEIDSYEGAIKIGQLYPNPVKTDQTLILELCDFIVSQITSAKIEIYHASGKFIYATTTEQEKTKLDFSKSPGFFVLYLTLDDGRAYAFRFLVK